MVWGLCHTLIRGWTWRGLWSISKRLKLTSIHIGGGGFLGRVMCGFLGLEIWLQNCGNFSTLFHGCHPFTHGNSILLGFGIHGFVILPFHQIPHFGVRDSLGGYRLMTFISLV